MRKFSCVALVIALLAVVVYLCSCASGGGTIDATDPLTPSPELKEGVVDPTTNIITITRDDITVTVDHWSRQRLNRKYTSIDTRSPFFYLDNWEQTFQSEVFYVTIKNDTPKNVVVNFKETILEDEREYKYLPSTIDDLKYKFVTKRYMDLKTKKGFELAPQIMLGEILGKERLVPSGQSVEGFIPFTTPSTQVEKVWLTVVLEREPEVVTGSYERVEFRFDYIQDTVLRKTQPPVKRY